MKRILLVEDDYDLRQAIHDLLSRKYDVTDAANGREAQELAGQSQFDLIVSDAQMPLMNGVEFLEWVRHEKPTPFILMTGYSEMLETRKTFDLNVDNFIVKPFMNTDLLDAIEEVLRTSAPMHDPERIKAI